MTAQITLHVNQGNASILVLHQTCVQQMLTVEYLDIKPYVLVQMVLLVPLKYHVCHVSIFLLLKLRGIADILCHLNRLIKVHNTDVPTLPCKNMNLPYSIHMY